MTRYAWTGRTKDGTLVSGTLEAGSKDEAVEKLQAQNITILSVGSGPGELADASRLHGMLPDSGWRGAITRIILSVVLVAGAAVMYSIAKRSTIRCAHDASGKTYDCAIDATGEITTRPVAFQNRLLGASSANAEEQTSTSQSRKSGSATYSSFTTTRIVIDARGPGVTVPGSISTPWMAYPFPGSARVARRLDAYLKGNGAAPFRASQVEGPPILVALVAALGAIWALVSGVRRVWAR